MKYYIGSTSVIDNLYFPNGEIVDGMAGGAGIYALAGAKLWSDEVHLVCSVGNDYQEKFNDWYKRNNLQMDFLHFIENKTPITEVYYQPNGERQEISKYGSAYYKKFEFSCQDFLKLTNKECGVYVFRNAEDDFWKPYVQRNSKKATVLWKIAADACFPKWLSKVKKILPLIDVFSLNITEAHSLFQTQEDGELLNILHALQMPLIFLRLGKKGQVFLKEGRSYFVPSIKNAKVIDVTGGGNSSSGAVLVGWCSGYSIEEIGKMANQSAIMCLAQFGVPRDILSHRKKLIQQNVSDITVNKSEVGKCEKR